MESSNRKIVIVTKKFGDNFTGATITTQRLIDKWLQYGYNIKVYTMHCGEIRSENIQKKVNVTVFRSDKKVIEYLKKESPSSIYYSDDHLGYLIHKAGRKYYHTYHGNWPDAKRINFDFFLKSFYFIPLYKRTIHYATNVINVSEYMCRFTTKYNPKFVIIRNGVDGDDRITGIADAHNKIVMVGNVDHRKYSMAIPVLAKLSAQNTDICIDIYGNCIDKKISKELSKISNVRLMGMKNKIPYKDYSVMVNTSKIENLSISVCEALKSGIAVVSFDVGGLPEVIRKGEGAIIPKWHIHEMVQQILFLNDKNISNTISSLKEFDWDIAARKYVNLFEEIIEKD